jgi:hypothetical protein
MKKSFIVAVFLFGTVTAPATFAAGAAFATSPVPATAGFVSADEDVLAAAGCCKERASPGKPWRRTQRDFDSCKQVNGKEDKDSVFKPSGNFWWDVAC